MIRGSAPVNPFLRAADILDPPEIDVEWWRENPGDSVPGRARAKQRPPDGDWLVWLTLTGRGFGKTRTKAEWINREALKAGPGEQLLIAGRTPADVRTFSLLGPGGLLTHHPEIRYEPSKRELTWPNGAKGVIRSGANPEEFRGFSGSTAWLDEFAAWDYPEECWMNLKFGVRERNPRIGISTTPRPIPVLKEIASDRATVVVTGSSDENRANLSAKWFETVIDPLRGTRLGRQEIEGQIVEDYEGALWHREWIERHRVRAAPPDLVRVIVGVDPQGRKGESRETGIVAAAEAKDGDYYVLDDGSLSGTPAEWGGRTVATFDRTAGDLIVGEANFGGEMVEATIRTVREKAPVKIVHASRGKAQRAEPIAALYQQGRVHHVGTFPALEDELCTWSPDQRFSPNRLDALVWALTELSTPALSKPRPTRATWGTGRLVGR